MDYSDLGQDIEVNQFDALNSHILNQNDFIGIEKSRLFTMKR
jgi:hypothetical protein